MKLIRYLSAVLPLAMVLLCSGGAALAQDKALSKIQAFLIQILAVQSDEVKLPIEFQLAVYENLIEQVQKANKFQHVYRDRDTAAASADNLVILHSNVYGFKQGSEGKRQVTTVTGATQIKVHCLFTDKAGKSELAQDVTGNVRFIRGKPNATFELAKEGARIVVTNVQ